MSQTIASALRAATFYSDNHIYRLVKLHPKAVVVAAGIIAEIGEPFCALIVDKDEVSLLIPDEAVTDFEKRLQSAELGETYRLITIDAVLEPDLLGFMAVVSRALADAQVGVFPYAAFTRDHILVPVTQFDRAIEALNKLQAQYL